MTMSESGMCQRKRSLPDLKYHIKIGLEALRETSSQHGRRPDRGSNQTCLEYKSGISALGQVYRYK